MTDNEIIKALEELVAYSGFTVKVKKLLHAVIDLIFRQKADKKELWEERNRIYESLKETKAELAEYRKAYITARAEIEALINGQETLQKHLAEKDAEIERLKNSFDAQASLIEKKNLAYDRICVKHRNEINTAKSEAIKEFAEKLKKEIHIRPTHSREQNEYVCFLIDNLVKELTEPKTDTSVSLIDGHIEGV